MNFFKKNLFLLVRRYQLLISSLLLALISIAITLFDPGFTLRWLSFNLWLLSVVMAFIALQLPFNFKRFKSVRFARSEVLLFLLLLTIALFSRFWLLTTYPFAPIGDGLRDGGLAAARIVRGEIKNIFAYDYDYAHNLVIPTLTSFAYRIFGENVLTYRLPAASIAIFSSLLLYFTARRFLGKAIAFWTTLILLSLPLHLYYARTEVVVIFSSFWTTATFYALGKFLEKRSLRNYAITGLVIGCAMGFHAAAKAMSLIALFLVLAISFYYFLKKVDRKTIALGLGLMLLLMVVGFGPRLVFSTPDVIFQTAKLNVLDDVLISPNTNGTDPTLKKLIQPFENYPTSLMIYISGHTTSHYHDKKPILNFVFAVFFVVGLVMALMTGNITLRIIGFFAVALPFTNSAITDAINADHRLTPLLPVASVLVAYGFTEVLKKISQPNLLFRLVRVTLVLLLLTTSGLSIFWFFDNEEASYNMFRKDDAKVYQDYMLTYGIKTVQNDKVLQNSSQICFTISPANLEYFNLLHIQEQFMFFLPGRVIETPVNNKVADNQLYISASCTGDITDGSWQPLDYCTLPEKFVCTPNQTTFKLFLRSS